VVCPRGGFFALGARASDRLGARTVGAGRFVPAGARDTLLGDVLHVHWTLFVSVDAQARESSYDRVMPGRTLLPGRFERGSKVIGSSE